MSCHPGLSIHLTLEASRTPSQGMTSVRNWQTHAESPAFVSKWGVTETLALAWAACDSVVLTSVESAQRIVHHTDHIRIQNGS